MSAFVSLRGFAIPYLQAEKCRGRLEYASSGTFLKFLGRSDLLRSVYLNFGHHDAELICRPVCLFSCDYGLGFCGSIARDIWESIRAYVTTNYSFCSVQLRNERTQGRFLADGNLGRHIVEADIEHITITNSPVYSGTAIWQVTIDRAAPPRIARLNAIWEQGCDNWRRYEAMRPRAMRQRHA